MIHFTKHALEKFTILTKIVITFYPGRKAQYEKNQ